MTTGNKGARSLSATVRAITSLPLDHFPLILPGVYSLAAPFILWKLKSLGYSGCSVKSTGQGLVVYAHR